VDWYVGELTTGNLGDLERVLSQARAFAKRFIFEDELLPSFSRLSPVALSKWNQAR
jgi:hypothetical protein